MPRKSEPSNWEDTIKSIDGIPPIITRRGFSGGNSSVRRFGNLKAFAQNNPLGFVKEMAGLHPTFALALWNAKRLMFPAESVKYVVRDKDDTVHEEGQKLVDQFIANNIQSEAGDLHGLHAILADELMSTGMCSLEVMPERWTPEGPQGAKRFWPVESLSLYMARPNKSADIQAYQLQRWAKTAPSIGIRLDRWNRYVPLPNDLFVYANIDAQVDDPYGMGPYMVALNEILADFATIRDLRDAVHNAGHPRYAYGVDMSNLHKVAVEVYNITDPIKAATWVKERIDEIRTLIEEQPVDGNPIMDTKGGIELLDGGDFKNLEPVLSFLRQRLAQALKTLPTLLGISENASFSYTSVEWAIYVAGLECIRGIIFRLVSRALEVHLRLHGLTDLIVVPIVRSIRTNDALVDANTEEVRIRNVIAKVSMGYITKEQGCEEITGHKPTGKEVDGIWESLVTKATAADGNGSRSSGNQGQGNKSKNNAST